jgi:parvulin-like peptidyl-prolyl isomerase
MDENTLNQNQESEKVEPKKGIKFPKIAKPGKKLLALVILALLLVGGLFAARKFLIVATVNNVPISRLEVINKLEKAYGKSITESLVLQEVVGQEAEKQGINISQQEIDDEMKKIEETVIAEGSTLEEAFEQQNVTREEVEEQIVLQKKLQLILEKGIQITDEEVNSYIESNKDQFTDEMSAEEKAARAREVIRQNQLSLRYQEWLDSVQNNPEIKYLIEY